MKIPKYEALLVHSLYINCAGTVLGARDALISKKDITCPKTDEQAISK